MSDKQAKIIDGKALAEKLREGFKVRVADFKSKYGCAIGLAVVKVGNDPASAVYVANKIRACEETGIKSFSYQLPEQATQAELSELIVSLNQSEAVNGILVQLPLPKHINEHEILALIHPKKDVDGFHAVNAGNLMQGNSALPSCTPAGIIQLIKSTGQEIAGKHAVVIGRSNIVGKPVALMLLANNATVTMCHSRTVNLADYTRSADILVVAIGVREFVRGDMIKEGAIVIDVGMNRADRLYGDVCFDEVSKVAGWITPVPRGVGPMTITMLLDNTINAAFAQR